MLVSLVCTFFVGFSNQSLCFWSFILYYLVIDGLLVLEISIDFSVMSFCSCWKFQLMLVFLFSFCYQIQSRGATGCFAFLVLYFVNKLHIEQLLGFPESACDCKPCQQRHV